MQKSSVSKQKRTPTPNQVLTTWAKQTGIGAADFARAMCFSYNHAAMLLRGEVRVTCNVLGRMLLAYGYDAVRPLADAMKADGDLKLKEMARSK